MIKKKDVKNTENKSYGKKTKFVFPTFVMGFILSCYIALSLFMYITRNNITVYEVNSGTVSNAEKIKGKIFRNETVYKANENGYLNEKINEENKKNSKRNKIIRKRNKN